MQRCGESEFLQLRQRIKESIRKKNMQNGSVIAPNSEQRKRNLPYNDFGSFFGPSQPVIASRVLKESKQLLENELLAEKMLNSIQSKKSYGPTSGSATKNANEEVKRKAEKLKESRDYSFLFSDDAELPVSIKEPPSRNADIPNSLPSCRGSQMDHSKPVSSGSQLQPRPGSSANVQAKTKEVSAINSQTHRKSSKLSPQRKLIPHQTFQRTLTSSKPLTCVPRQERVEQRKVSQELTRSPSKHRVISKPPLKQPHQLMKKKKKMSENDKLALRMVREMCRTDRYAGRDFEDYDDESMETNFEDIIKEEKRSEKLAKKEDAEQLRLIEEEDRRERVRKKKQKLLSH